MKKVLFSIAIVAVVATIVSCGNTGVPRQSGDGLAQEEAVADSSVAMAPAEPQTEGIPSPKGNDPDAAVKLTYANMNGIYDSLDEDMNSVSRISLNADGTASWCMVGSLNYTEYTYRIEGNTICMKAKGVDSEEECYEYDSDTRTLKNEQGAVYYRQVAE